MRCLSFAAPGLALPVWAFLLSPALACPQYDAATAAVESSDAATAARLYEEIVIEPRCDDSFRGWMAHHLAREHFLMGMDQGSDAPTRRAAFEASLGYERHWRSYQALGQLAWDAGDYTQAAGNLQLAINELVEGPADNLASKDEIAALYQLATAAVALSDEVVDLPRTRSGNEGGIFATNIRGYVVEEIPLPITFEFDSVSFDATGAAYAGILAEHLLTFGPQSITLAGHTDPVGGDEYNLDLSEERAKTLASFVRDHGYGGDITVVGLGRSQLPSPPPGIEDGSKEHHRIARRVTFSRQ